MSFACTEKEWNLPKTKESVAPLDWGKSTNKSAEAHKWCNFAHGIAIKRRQWSSSTHDYINTDAQWGYKMMLDNDAMILDKMDEYGTATEAWGTSVPNTASSEASAKMLREVIR